MKFIAPSSLVGDFLHTFSHIESGRHKNPMVPRSHRTCKLCPSKIENEFHVIYECVGYCLIRSNYNNLLSKKTNLKLLLNPTNTNELIETGNFLKEIESLHNLQFKQ